MNCLLKKFCGIVLSVILPAIVVAEEPGKVIRGPLELRNMGLLHSTELKMTMDTPHVLKTGDSELRVEISPLFQNINDADLDTITYYSPVKYSRGVLEGGELELDFVIWGIDGNGDTIPFVEDTQADRSGVAGIGDLKFSYKYQFFNQENGSPVNYAFKFVSKYPTGDWEKLLGTNQPAFGLINFLSREFDKHAVTFNLGLTLETGDPFWLQDYENLINADIGDHSNFGVSFGLAYDYLVRDNIDIVAQIYGSTNTFPGDLRDSGVEEFEQFPLEMAVGLKWAPLKGFELNTGFLFGITEAAPDYGFHESFVFKF